MFKCARSTAGGPGPSVFVAPIDWDTSKDLASRFEPPETQRTSRRSTAGGGDPKEDGVKNTTLVQAGLLVSGLLYGMGCGDSPAGSVRESCHVGEPGCLDAPRPPGAANTAGVGSAAIGNTATTASGATVGATMASDLPCDVATVVGNNCISCHADQPKFGANMPLTKLQDFHAPAKSDPTRKVFQVIPERLSPADATKKMPPASSAPLSAPDLRALSDWAKAGAKPGATGGKCATPASGVPAPGATAMPGVTPIEYNDPEMKCYRFTAHAPGDKNTPFSVDTTPDTYTGFTFMPPWQGMMYARSFKTIIDNDEVIHHWLFFRNAGPGTDGEVAEQIGAHPDGSLVQGWAPGGEDQYLEPDVGIEMPGGVSYMLEAHYNNTGKSAALDASGVEVCVTPKVPKKVASISWLGTDLIVGPTAEGTCAPTSKEPITLIGGTPHMHLKGRHMKVVINRADGSKETLSDRPFDFQYQVSYRFNQTLMPGDTVTTSCTYSEPTTYGRGTNDEMCYLFTLYYPKLALTNGDLLGTSLHGPDTCLPTFDPGGDTAGSSSDDENLIPGVDIPFLPGI